MAYLDKQVLNIKERHGISAAQSREHQRNWNEKAWGFALEKGNYDLARQHLNYEIAKGGKIQPIDRSKSMPERMAETLAARGIKDPNVGRKVQNVRTVVDFVFSGSPAQMHKLAFGDQPVTIMPGNNTENLSVHYTPEFEQWSKDIYKFVCDHWGEENIIGFYVHGDETTPHIHATIVPIKNNKIDYKGVFIGDVDDKTILARNLAKLHDELAELNAKYGLDRGSSLTSKNAKKMQTHEWRRMMEDEGREKELELAELDNQLDDARQLLRMAEKRVKGLTTMIENKEAQKKELEQKLAELHKKIEKGEGDRATLEREIAETEKKIDATESQLADKKAKLEKAQQELADTRVAVEQAQKDNAVLQARTDELSSSIRSLSGTRVREAMLDKVIGDFKQLKATLPTEQLAAFEGSFLESLAERGNEMLRCGVLLFAELANDATTFAEGHGGGGGGSDLKWGRDEDEDDRRWARRCVAMANQLMRPSQSWPKALGLSRLIIRA